MNWLRHLLYASAVVALAPAVAYAQYPRKPVRMIIPFPPGGGTDVIGRLVCQKLTDALRQQCVVDNRPGAGANIGTELVAKSPPDGHTMLLSTISNAISASLYPRLNYDLIADFAPVTLLANQPLLLTVHPSLPVKSVKDVVALAKRSPNQVTYSSAGNGTPTHLAGELFSTMAGIRMVHVPYKGGGPSVTALIGGEVMVSLASLPSVLQFVRAGRLRGIAVSSAHRSASAPEIPTITESGVSGYDVSAWYGLLVPAGTPADIVARLNGETIKLLNQPDSRQVLEKSGFEMLVSTPEEYGAFLKTELRKWAGVVKSAGVRID